MIDSLGIKAVLKGRVAEEWDYARRGDENVESSAKNEPQHQTGHAAFFHLVAFIQRTGKGWGREELSCWCWPQLNIPLVNPCRQDSGHAYRGLKDSCRFCPIVHLPAPWCVLAKFKAGLLVGCTEFLWRCFVRGFV